MTARQIFVGMLLASSLAIGACSKVNADNYAKVDVGMTREQVQAILGKPDETADGSLGGISIWGEKWKGRKETINVTYIGAKLTLKDIKPNDK